MQGVASNPPCDRSRHYELDSWTSTGSDYDLRNAEVIRQNNGQPVVEVFETSDDNVERNEKPVEVTRWENENGQWEGKWDEEDLYNNEQTRSEWRQDEGDNERVVEVDNANGRPEAIIVENNQNGEQWTDNEQQWDNNGQQWGNNGQQWDNNGQQWDNNGQQWDNNDQQWESQDKWGPKEVKPHYYHDKDCENNAVIKEKVKSTTTKLRAETVVHKPSHIIVNQPPTKVLIHHPPLIVKPSPVVFHRAGKTIHRPVKHQYLPRKVEERKVYHTVVKPIEKKVLIDSKKTETSDCKQKVIVNKHHTAGCDKTWVEHGQAYEAGKEQPIRGDCGCPNAPTQWEDEAK